MAFSGRFLVIGLGSVSRCTLPLLFRHVAAAPSQYTVIDFAEVGRDARWVGEQGATFVPERVTRENFGAVLGRYVGPGDVIIDLAWNLGTADLLAWCRAQGVRYVNASLEVWDPYGGIGTEAPVDRTLYARHMALRDMIARWGDNRGPTAVLDHGANPGLVSHFVKAGLIDIAERWLESPGDDGPGGREVGGSDGSAMFGRKGDFDVTWHESDRRQRVVDALADRHWARLAQALGVKVIHISERDTQVSVQPKRENEFVNTWSVEGFYEEGIAPAELGWGTHERTLPPGAQVHERGPRNQICIAHPGCRTWVRSWVPCGEIVGMVIRHGEAFSISEALTVPGGTAGAGAAAGGGPGAGGTAGAGAGAVYRPTVHYAYCPCDAAIASLHELHMRRDDLQADQRIMNDDIISGRDELGCLLMGHPLTSWWIGSLLDIDEARRLVPGQNATTLQVAAAVLGAVQWLLDNPDAGVRLPDDLPFEEVLRHARPYLGPFVSEPNDWTPLRNWSDPYAGYGRGGRAGRPGVEDTWQFSSFLVQGP